MSRARRLTLVCPAAESLCVAVDSTFAGDAGGSVDELTCHSTTSLRSLHGSLSRLPVAPGAPLHRRTQLALELAGGCGSGGTAHGEGILVAYFRLRSITMASANSTGRGSISVCETRVS